MKILLLGNTGQVGWELHRTLLTLGELTALDYPQIDMADPASIHTVVRDAQPNIIVNATAYTDVDKAESEPALAMAINGTGPGILAEEAMKLGSALIHYSTDYVFDGTKGEPYTEEDQPNPLNVYGETKLAGERAIQDVGGAYLIFRTSWVYSLRRPCFVTKVLQWAREHETLRIVDDQVSSPTWARTLAEATAQIIAQGRGKPVDYINEKSGLYHLAGGGSCSRYEWAKAILELDPDQDEYIVKKLHKAKTGDFLLYTKRPLFSVLNCQKFNSRFSLSISSWLESLSIFFKLL
ncbi:dTDP-4-dehydrorhamnose reductase [Patescibacteria group bacterium]|nr:dTDP-4-dehydrorhamnose reductase [Patescibacteria group bacterium]